MFIDKNSIIIDNINMGQYLVQATFGFYKLWGEDSGRNLNGDIVASLIGIYPKITLQFRKLSQSELEIIIPILDKARQNVTYYDPNKKTNITIETYTGDYEIINKKIIDNHSKNEGFQVSFISVSKRG